MFWGLNNLILDFAVRNGSGFSIIVLAFRLCKELHLFVWLVGKFQRRREIGVTLNLIVGKIEKLTIES